jgi:hypothetical protein
MVKLSRGLLLQNRQCPFRAQNKSSDVGLEEVIFVVLEVGFSASSERAAVKLPKTPFFVHFAKFGSSVGGIVSELPTIRPEPHHYTPSRPLWKLPRHFSVLFVSLKPNSTY